ncbi:MAG: prolipoprotein diacylglyceryl transferase [Clostridia bacterium]|nr:prolipoprotein diacylglyceryl transferase [Clostridia bacterium]
MTQIAFPNIGIDTFKINPVAINLFGLEIRWYGLIIMVGILLAFSYAYYRSKQESFTSDDMLDLFIYTVLSGVIGARLYYVLTSLDSYNSIADAFKIWNGGIAIYGAIIGGGIAIAVVCKIKKRNILSAFDMIAPGVMIGQLIGRWGNFCNGEAFGDISKFEFLGLNIATPGAKDLPWIMQVSSEASRYNTVIAHPTFLYESLWNLVGFIIINALYSKKKFNGQIFFMYIGWYGLGRMFIEGLRSDSLYIGPIKISQLIGLLCLIVSIAVCIFMLIKNRKNKKETQNGENN